MIGRVEPGREPVTSQNDAVRPHLFIASMDIDAERESAFHEVYDTEHVVNLAEVPGVLGIRRYESRSFALRIGGQVVEPSVAEEPRFTAIYELRDPEVLLSPEWGAAIERGRWPTEVRPYTLRRRHLLLRPL
jgi:hypothetical protein